MVKRILNLLNKEVRGLHQAAYLLAAFSFLSQLLGIVRDRLLAHSFGAGGTLDIYYAAFKIPDFIFVSAASVVSVFVLVPFLVDKIDRNVEEGKKFIDNIFSAFFVFIILISVVAFFLVPYLSKFLFPGFQGESLDSLITVTRIFLLSPILLGLSNLFSSVTQVYRKFIIYALSPLLYNIGIIIGLLFFYPAFGISGLAYGVVLGAFLHLLVQIPTVLQAGFFPRLNLRFKLSVIAETVRISLPRTLTLAVNNIALLVLISLASVIGEGSITVFSFSFNLQSVPLTIIGVSYSVAAFPTLARYFSIGDRLSFARNISVAARHIIFWSIPGVFLFIVLRAQIVRTILGSGQFSWDDTRLTAAALALFALSLLAQALILLFVRGYYAAGYTRKPLIINTLSSILIVASGLFLVELFNNSDVFRFFMEKLLRIEGIEGSAIIMLPLAYSIGMIINLLVLWQSFKKDFREFSVPIKEAFFHSVVASFFMAFTTFQFLRVFDNVFDINTFWGIFLQGFLSGIIGILFGIFILKIFGNREIEEIWKSFHTKFWKTEALGE